MTVTGTERPEATAAAPVIDRPVVLVGLMGSGKSTVGRRLATRLRVPFVDADTAIEDRAGRSVAEIFAAAGEPAFRALEAQVMRELVHDGPPAVIASGGGAVLDAGTRRLLVADATTVWLRGSPEALAQRLRPDGSRPLLTEDPRTVLRRLDAERSPLYERVAHVVVEVGRADRRAVVEQIEAELRALLAADDAQEAHP